MIAEPAATGETELAGTPRSDPRPVLNTAEEPAEATLAAGQTLGNYRIIRAIGRGGMGGVYLAEHVLLQRQVALKVLNPRWANDVEAVLRFEREAVAAAQLDHPHIVRVHDAQRQNGLAFLVLEYVPGEDLGQHLRTHGALPWRLAVECVRQVAEALAYSHRSGIVHRDIKPQNLLYTAGLACQSGAMETVKILDLGLAKLAHPRAGDTVRLTQDDSFIGTVGYMAPEQIVNPQRADARSDIYSLGCTLYVLLTGEPVFSGSTPERLRAHLSAPVPSLRHSFRNRDSGSDITAETLDQLDALLQTMLAKDPADRIPSMEAVVRHLKGIATPGLAPPLTNATAVADIEPVKRKEHPGGWSGFARRVAAVVCRACVRIAGSVRPTLTTPVMEFPLESSLGRVTETLFAPNSRTQ